MALRQRVSPRTISNPMLSPSTKSGFPFFMIRDCGRTIEPKTHTSRCAAENENSSGSNRRGRPSGSFQSTPPSRTPSTSNAIFYPDVFSRSFEPRRLLSGIRVGLLPDPDHHKTLATAAVNVSMPFESSAGCRLSAAPSRARRLFSVHAPRSLR